MTARATAAVLFTALGLTAAFATIGAADPPVSGSPATVWRTITETRVIHKQVDGHTVGWWRAKAIANRREANQRRITLKRIRAVRQRQWRPTVSYAIHLAASVFGVDENKMRHVAYCESTWNPYAQNGRYRGIFQLGWSPYGLSPYDPVANALSAAQTVARDGSWRQWSCG